MDFIPGKSVGLVLDYQKHLTPSTIKHSHRNYPINKLETLQISGLKVSFSSRGQFTSVNYDHSAFLDIACSVPQGSILPSLLFMIYMIYE